MAHCALLKGCLFLNDKMPEVSGMGLIYKKKYCFSDNANCARYGCERVRKRKGSNNHISQYV